MVEVSLNGFIEIERKLLRNHAHYYLFCIIKATGVKIKYPHFNSTQAQGFSSSLYHDLTTGIDKVYNVIVKYDDKAKGREWHMVIPTQVPDKAVRELYGLRCCAMDIDTESQDT